MSQITSFFNGSGAGTVASVTGGVGINITGNPSLNPVVNLDVPVTIAHGGTNAITMTNTNGVNYFDGTSIVTTTVGTAGQILTSQGVGLPPVFTSIAPGGVISVSGANGINITGAPATPTVNLDIPVTIAHGGTNAITMTNTYGVNYFDGTSIVTTTVGTAGQVLTSNGAGVAPTFQTTTNIVWSVETVDLTAVVNHGYIANKAGLLTITLPTTAAIGSTIIVTGINTDVGWRIAQNVGQTIYFGDQNTTTGATGYLESTQKRDTVQIVCVVADTDWNVIPGTQGNITVA